MKKSFFTRMSLCIINKCNQKCSWCFEGRWKDKPLMTMSVDDVEKLIRWKNWENGEIPIVFILGGEPTIHPDLLNILGRISSVNPIIKKALLTNLTCGSDMLSQLLLKDVVFFINVDQFEKDNNVSNQGRILKNLETLNSLQSRGFSYNISATVSSPDKDFTFLYDIIRNGREKIYNVRIAASCIGYNFENQFQKDSSDDYYEKVYEIIVKCREINPYLQFSSECAVNGCMVSPRLYKKLESAGYKLRFECGDPEPNADILPDLSCHWCFAFEGIPDMSVKNVLEYPDYDSMINALTLKYQDFVKKNTHQCTKEHCTNELCKGPCAALNYFNEMHG